MKFCTYCGKELKWKTDGPFLKQECPKYWPWYRFLMLPDYRHTSLLPVMRDFPRRYDPRTGQRVK